MQVLLLDISCLPLEGKIARTAIYQQISFYDTRPHSRRTDVEQCGLAGARYAHQGSKSARFDPSVHFIENDSLFVLDWHGVGQVFPVEYGRLLESFDRLLVGGGI